MDDLSKQASEAGSLMAKRRHEIAKKRLGKIAYSKLMSDMAKRPRPNRRKKAKTGDQS